MKYKLNQIIILGIILVFSLLLSAVFLMPKKVSFRLIKECQFPIQVTKYPFKSFHDYESLKDVLLNEDNKLNLFADALLSRKWNFEKNDYILTFGSKLVELDYTMFFRKKYDDCEYLDKIPVKAKLSENEKTKKSIFIYVFEKYNKYRSPCP